MQVAEGRGHISCIEATTRLIEMLLLLQMGEQLNGSEIEYILKLTSPPLRLSKIKYNLSFVWNEK